MEKFIHAFVNTVNQARTSPTTFSESLSAQIGPNFHDEEFRYYDKCIETFEGVEALHDFKQYMKKTPSSGYLTISNALNAAAQSIAEEKGASGRVDNESPKILFQKISLNGHAEGKIGELIALKTSSSEQTSTYFLLDDGLATRKRRRMLLDNEYKFIGVGAAFHKTYGQITVVLLAENVRQLTSLQKSMAKPVDSRHEMSTSVNRQTYQDY